MTAVAAPDARTAATALIAADGLAVSVPRPDLVARLRGERLVILDDVSIAVGPGETVGLVGESGSGKTTLARALLGLARRSAGSLRFEGREIGPQDAAGWKRLRRHAAFMHQDAIGALSPRLSVGTLVTEPFVIHGLPMGDRADKAAELLDRVGLPRISRGATRTSSPADRRGASAWPARWRWSRGWWSPTSRPRAST